MKQKDILLVIVIAFIGVIVSLVVSRTLFASPAQHNTEVEIVQPITDSFPNPDNRYFNDKAFNPTKSITIGTDNSKDPFKATSSQQ